MPVTGWEVVRNVKSMAAAIEFGTSKIVTVVGEGNGEGPAQLLGFGVVPYDGYSDAHWNASDEDVDQAILKSVREAELSSGREIKEIYVGVPGDFIHLEQNEVTLELDGERRITPEDVDDVMNLALDYKNKQDGVIIHRSPAWFTVDDRRTMEPAGLKGSVVKCMASFVIADATFLEDIRPAWRSRISTSTAIFRPRWARRCCSSRRRSAIRSRCWWTLAIFPPRSCSCRAMR